MNVQHDYIIFTGVLGDVPRVSNQRTRGQKDAMTVPTDHIIFTGVLGDVPRVSNQRTRGQRRCQLLHIHGTNIPKYMKLDGH
jgi:ribosome biogenesis SPOUT family RNA methylase Rps3